MFSVSIAGQDSRECVCHRRHPGHTDELHSLCVFLGHHCPESWIQAFLWQEGQFRFWWGKFLKEICYLLLICFLYAFVMVGFFVWFFFFNLFYVSVPRLRYLEQTDCCNMLLTVRVLSALICFSMGGRDSLKLIEVLSRYNSLWLFFFSDLLTVSETANEPPQEEGNSFNSPRNLAMEATYINHNFSQQCLRMVRPSSPGQ